MKEDIPLFRISWGADEVKNTVDSVTRGSFWANGPYVDEFESQLAEYFEVEHAVVFNSGTSALIAALDAHGVGKGDEVIVPAFTFISTANAVQLVDAVPRFVDIEPDRYGLDPAAVEDAITEDTAAILPVHYAGAACKIGAIRNIAATHDVALIEDAAEAFGATVDGELAGTFGDSSILSFCQNKVITTGEGGALLTEDDEVAGRARLVCSHGRSSSDYFDTSSGGEYVSLGQNYRMPDVVAALGVAQIERASNIIDQRRTVAHRYSDAIEGIPHVSPPTEPSNGRHVYQLYTVTFDEVVDRDAVIQSLETAGVSSKIYFEPVHHASYYRTTATYEADDLSATESISKRVLSLPMDPDMEQETSERVITALERALMNAT